MHERLKYYYFAQQVIASPALTSVQPLKDAKDFCSLHLDLCCSSRPSVGNVCGFALKLKLYTVDSHIAIFQTVKFFSFNSAPL